MYIHRGNSPFLAYIPSWWKNQPSLVKVGVACPLPTPFHYIYYHLLSCSVRSSWESRSVVQIHLPPFLFIFYTYTYSVVLSVNYKRIIFPLILRWNSWKYNFVEVSGHNLENSLTWGFYLRLPFNKMLFINNLEFSSLVDCFWNHRDGMVFCQVFLLSMHL
jgi:hypothetical protein